MYSRTKLPESLPAETVRGFSADLKGLIAWLETMPPEEKYNYGNCSGACLVSQFAGVVAGRVLAFKAAEQFLGQDHFGPGRFNPLAALRPFTFGAALRRARSALREGGIT